MPSVLAYHRPVSLDEAAKLMSQDRHIALAGGTAVVPEARKQNPHGVEMVDLQALGLESVKTIDEGLQLGSMVRLGDLIDNADVPDLLKDAARRELPSALRNQATVGGTIAQADTDSVLLAALLVHEALVHLHDQPSITVGDYLNGSRRGLIVSVTIETAGAGAIASTGRTPADTPIVAAVTRATNTGPRLALTGVAATPVEVEPTSPTSTLDPPGDFRGSTTYRIRLAKVLSARALAEVN